MNEQVIILLGILMFEKIMSSSGCRFDQKSLRYREDDYPVPAQWKS